jgi:serine/threonine-protein kinase SRPK3
MGFYQIMTAESAEKFQELRNLHALANSLRESLSSNYIVQLLDEFTHQGPNGTHKCLAFELLSPSVRYIVEDYHAGGESLEPEAILRLSEQLLQATAFIHGAGMAHGRMAVTQFCALHLPLTPSRYKQQKYGFCM